MGSIDLTRIIGFSRIQQLLCKNPVGWELSLMREVSQCTARWDIHALECVGMPPTQNGSRWGIMEGYMLPLFSLLFHEAAAMFLVARVGANLRFVAGFLAVLEERAKI